ncbi:MAG: acyl-CoA thioesterase [Lachnospiraceae bacterium]
MEKRMKDSMTEKTFLLMPRHSNASDMLFGGQLMEWIDEMGGIVSRRHCNTETITASVDQLNFQKGASIGEMIVLIGRMTYVGRTSMEVKVDTYVERMDGKRYQINSAYLVMVSIDKERNPLPVPSLLVETETEKEEWESAKRRYDLRKQRRIEGF